MYTYVGKKAYRINQPEQPLPLPTPPLCTAPPTESAQNLTYSVFVVRNSPPPLNNRIFSSDFWAAEFGRKKTMDPNLIFTASPIIKIYHRHMGTLFE